jgi:hypothetical protein
MELKANPVATGVLVAGIALAPAALAASVALAPAALVVSAVLAPVAPVVSAALVRAVRVRADLALRVDLAATVALGRRVDPAAMAALALLGIPRADPVAMDLVADLVVRTSVLSR